MEVFPNTLAVIILQYVNVSHQHSAYLITATMLHVNYSPVKLGERPKMSYPDSWFGQQGPTQCCIPGRGVTTDASARVLEKAVPGLEGASFAKDGCFQIILRRGPQQFLGRQGCRNSWLPLARGLVPVAGGNCLSNVPISCWSIFICLRETYFSGVSNVFLMAFWA